MTLKAKIASIGGFVPTKRRTNSDLAALCDTTEEWIVQRTGIEERRILEHGLATSDMIVEALINMLVKTDFTLEEVDCLIVATTTPDMPMPSTANIVCRKVGIHRVFCFDINAACSGFLYALAVGNAFIQSGQYANVLVVGSDKMSSVTDLYDRNTNILFGDGAGIVHLQASEEHGILDSILEGNGEGIEYLNIEAGGSRFPSSLHTILANNHYIKQEGKVVFRHAVEKMTAVCQKILQKNNFSIDDVDWLIPHQGNRRIINTVGKNLGIDADKVLINIEHYGNTTAATIPLCLWEFQHRFKKGDLILLTSFGAGFSWGATLVRWT